MNTQDPGIFQRILNGEAVPFSDSEYFQITEACNSTKKLLIQLNNEPDAITVRKLLSQIIAS